MAETLTPQQAELVQKLTDKNMSPSETFSLIGSMLVPFIPLEWRLNLYFFITSVSTNFHLYIPALIAALIFIPLFSVIVNVAVKFYFYRRLLKEHRTFLELKPFHKTEQSAYSTKELFNKLHNISAPQSLLDRFLNKRRQFSLEINASKHEGIRYILQVPTEQKDIITKSILSYLPTIKIAEISDYLPTDINPKEGKVSSFKLTNHFAYPLESQKALSEHDPIAYITGNMTKLSEDEHITIQIVANPIIGKKAQKATDISNTILNSEDVFGVIHGATIPFLLRPPLFVLKIILFIALSFITIPLAILNMMFANDELTSFFPHKDRLFPGKKQVVYNPKQDEIVDEINQKLDQQLFEVSFRTLVISRIASQRKDRNHGLISSLASFTNPGWQSLKPARFISLYATILTTFFKKIPFVLFKNRSMLFAPPLVLSASELSDIYHFPYSSTTKTEDLAKSYSNELPAPLSLKQNRDLNVVFGTNSYGGTQTQIGLTKEDREPHMFIIGRTGSGKTTLMFSMAKSDIEKGEGLAFLDPHGDVAEDLLAIIPERRKNDLIYFNPFDLKYPIGINILELTPGLEEDELEMEKELVAEGVISLFRTIFNKEENADAHRIEYILRNTIYTAFTVKDPTIFTVYKLLNNPTFQKEVTKNLENEDLKDFWKNEFGRAGDYQIVKMIAGVTAKIGRFLFSPTAKRILEQKKSTINFDKIMDEGKILVCNISQGKLGDDTSRLMGTMILTKLQQATLRRARMEAKERRPFYLYVDEFQNFASQSFTKMLSGGRKFGLRLIIAEQTTSQQQDHDIVNIILANTGTVICFRSANPVDEDLMLAQFAPVVEKGEIINLPKYRFFIKISATEPEESFTGETIYEEVKKNKDKIEKLIQASRNNWAIEYKSTPISEVKKVPVKGAEKPSNGEQMSEKKQPEKLLPDVAYDFE